MKIVRNRVDRCNERRAQWRWRLGAGTLLVCLGVGCDATVETEGNCNEFDGPQVCPEHDGGLGGTAGNAGTGGAGNGGECGHAAGAAGAAGACNMPIVEDCSTPADENCDGLTVCSGTPIYLHGYGDDGMQIPMDVAVDRHDNTIVVGVFDGLIDFGAGPITSHQLDDVFIAKFDSTNTCIWSRSFGDDETQSIERVVVDSAGNIIVVGHFRGSIDLGGGPLVSAGARDVFVAKLDPSGGHIWSRGFGGPLDQFGRGIATDANGNVFVAGTFWGTADFAGIPRTSAGWEDIFVVKLDADGNPVWVRTFGDAETQETWDLAADYAGNVVLTGFALGNVDFGDGLRPGAGAPDVIVVKLDGNGQTLWSRRYGDEGMQFGHTITVDAQNNVIVTGEGSGAIDFGDGAVGGAGALDFFVVKLDSGGNVVWHRHYGDAANQNGIFGAADRSGAVLLTGSFQGSVDFGGGVLWSAGATDAFVAKLDKDGNFLWSWSVGDAQTQAGTAIAAKSLGRAVVAGKVWGTIDLGGGLSVSGGNITSNAFMLEAEP